MMSRSVSLYESVLGADFGRLPSALQRLHSGVGVEVAGALRVWWSARPWLRAPLFALPLPRPAVAAPCRVSMAAPRGSEQWRRTIGGIRLSSRMTYAASGVIVERLGPLELHLDTWVTRAGHIRQASRSVLLFGIPLGTLHVFAIERAMGERDFAIDVRIVLRGVGDVLRYGGKLRVCEPCVAHSKMISSEKKNGSS